MTGGADVVQEMSLQEGGVKKRNPMAGALAQGQFQGRAIPVKKRQPRRVKHRQREVEYDGD